MRKSVDETCLYLQVNIDDLSTINAQHALAEATGMVMTVDLMCKILSNWQKRNDIRHN